MKLVYFVLISLFANATFVSAADSFRTERFPQRIFTTHSINLNGATGSRIEFRRSPISSRHCTLFVRSATIYFVDETEQTLISESGIMPGMRYREFGVPEKEIDSISIEAKSSCRSSGLNLRFSVQVTVS